MERELAVRINSKLPAASAAGQQKGAAAYALLSAASSDVDSKKHKKDPFNTRYVQLCLTGFSEVKALQFEYPRKLRWWQNQARDLTRLQS